MCNNGFEAIVKIRFVARVIFIVVFIPLESLGAIFLGIAAVSVVTALALPPDNYVWPIIAIVAAFAIVISLIATGGKKWDEGDNTQVGYKDYRTRKKEEEAREAEEERNRK